MAITRILFVEDNEALRTVLAETLERQGYQVVEAASIHAARDALLHTPAYDLIVVDLAIAGREDEALVAEVRRLAASIPKIYTSGYPRIDAERLFDFPADAHFMAKPFSVGEFLMQIRALTATPT